MVPGSTPPPSSSNGAQELLRHAYYAVVIPLGLGTHQIGTALHEEHWLSAMKAAGATGAAVAVLVISIAMAQLVVRFLASRER